MGRDVAISGAIEWGARDPGWERARAPGRERADWPLELPDDARGGLEVHAWLEALRARAGAGAIREEATRTVVAAWLDDRDLADIGRGVCAALLAAGRFGGKGVVHLVAPDGSLGYALRIGTRPRLEALTERALARALETLPPPPIGQRPEPHALPGASPRATPAASPRAAPPAALEDLERLLARTKRFDAKKRLEVRALLASLHGEPLAIEPLVGWLDHDEDEVAHGAADVLLGHDCDAALAPLASRAIGRHRAAAVAATFKRAPDRALAAFGPVLDALEATPDVPVLPATPALVLLYLELALRIEAGERVVGAAFDFARHRLPTRVWDARWAARLALLSAVRDPVLTAPRILARAADPRAGEGYLRAIDALGMARVAAQLAHDRPRGVRAALEQAAADPARAAIANELSALARKLPM